ncbi:MAG: hypothetical protein M5U13_13210 [Thermoanaerobaculia bacterium]|nr:hypothetical protein [Thermoanaerobaculia bacterium]
MLSALAGRVPGLEAELFTTVPAWFFAESLPSPFVCHAVVSDVGLVQRSAVDEDPAATRERLAAFWPPAPAEVARLAELLLARGCRAVLSDISPLGLVVAEAAGLPSLLVESFTWDWIYADYLAEEPGLAPFAEAFAALYAAAPRRLRAEPFCGDAPGQPVSPIARPTRSTPAATRERLGIAPERAMVLVSMGGVPWRFGDLAAWRRLPEVDFVIPGGAEEERRHGNLLLLPHHTPVYHPDLVAAADLVVGKLGYSTVAEAARAGCRFAYLPRPRFRESEVLAAWVEARLPALRLTADALADDRWLAALPELLARPRSAAMPVRGAEEVANALLELLGPG